MTLEAFYSFLLPQFEGEDTSGVMKLYSCVAPLVGDNGAKLRRHLKDVLGVEVQAAIGHTNQELDEDPAPEELTSTD